TKVGDQVQAPAKRLDVACDDIQGGVFAVFDLGDTSDADAHEGRNVLLEQPGPLAGFGELVAASFSEQSPGSSLDLSGGDAGRVQFGLQCLPVLRYGHGHSSSSGVV